MEFKSHSRKGIVAWILLQHSTKALISKLKVILLAADGNY